MIPKFIWLTFHIHCLDVTHLSPSLQWTYLRGKKKSIYFRLRFMLPCQIIEWECQQPHMTKKIYFSKIVLFLSQAWKLQFIIRQHCSAIGNGFFFVVAWYHRWSYRCGNNFVWYSQFIISEIKRSFPIIVTSHASNRT